MALFLFSSGVNNVNIDFYIITLDSFYIPAMYSNERVEKLCHFKGINCKWSSSAAKSRQPVINAQFRLRHW